MLSPFIRDYALQGIAGLPPIVGHLLQGLVDDCPIWDQRPDPKRFSLREILPHMAEFDEVWHYRITRILREDSPPLPDWDEDAAVTLNNYASTVPSEQLARLAGNRAKLCELLNSTPSEAWDRTATPPPGRPLLHQRRHLAHPGPRRLPPPANHGLDHLFTTLNFPPHASPVHP